MRKILISALASASVVLGTFGAITSASAQDTDAWQTYIGGDYQYLSLSYKGAGSSVLPDSLSQGINIHVGERFGTYYAAEIGYMSSDASKNFTLLKVPYTSKATVSGPTLDAYAFLPLWHGPVSLVGTAGVSYLDGKAEITGPSGSIDSGKSEFGYRAGGGVEWRPTQNFGLRVIARYQSADFNGVANHAFVGSLGFNFYF